jgi:hypothetical protein
MLALAAAVREEPLSGWEAGAVLGPCTHACQGQDMRCGACPVRASQTEPPVSADGASTCSNYLMCGMCSKVGKG